jgi:hypothetical protein
MLHSQSAQSVDVNQDFPVSLEFQLLGGKGSGETTTGNVCTPGTQIHFHNSLITDHCTSSTSKTYNGDQWVSGIAEVYGDSLPAYNQWRYCTYLYKATNWQRVCRRYT